MDLNTSAGLAKLEQYLAQKYESLLAEQDLDHQIEQLEAKLRSFHVTSPPSRDIGTLGALQDLNLGSEEDAVTPTNSDTYIPPQVLPHGFDWSSRTGTQAINPSDIKLDVGITLDTEPKSVVWTDIGEIPRRGHCVIHQPEPCRCNTNPSSQSDNNNRTKSDTANGESGLSSSQACVHEAADSKTDEGYSDNESESTSFYTAASSPLSHSFGSDHEDGMHTPDLETSIFLAG